MFSHMKLGAKVMLTLAVMVVMMIAIGTYNASRLRQAGESETVMYEQITVPLENAGEFVLRFYRAWTNVSNAGTARDATERSNWLGQVEPRLLEADAALENLDKAVKVDVVREQVAAVISAYHSVRQELMNATQTVRKGETESIIKSMTEGNLAKERQQLGEEYARLSKLFVARGKARSDANTAAIENAIHASIALLILAAAAAVLTGILLFNNIAKTIRGVRQESEELARHITAGQLSARANLEEVNFEFREIVDGFNKTLDAITHPISVTLECINRIGKGDIPPKITTNTAGDFETLKNSLNACIDSLNTVLSRSAQVYEAHKAGEIEVFAKEDDLAGAYQQLAHGVNDGLRLHIKNALDILGIVTFYAEGNFEPVLRKLPGRQAIANLRDPLIGIKEFQTLEQKPVARKLGGQMRPLGAQATPPASLEWLHTNSCLG